MLIAKVNFAGGYYFGEYVADKTKYTSLLIQLPYKPNIIKRFFMKHCLGFVWKDTSESITLNTNGDVKQC